MVSNQTIDSIGRVIVIVQDRKSASNIKDILLSGQDFVADSKYRYLISHQAAEIRMKTKGGLSKNSNKSKWNTNKNTNNSNNNNNNNNNDDNNIKETIITIEENNNIKTDSDPFGLGLSMIELEKITVENKLILIQELELKRIPAILPKYITDNNDNEMENYNLYEDTENTENSLNKRKISTSSSSSSSSSFNRNKKFKKKELNLPNIWKKQAFEKIKDVTDGRDRSLQNEIDLEDLIKISDNKINAYKKFENKESDINVDDENYNENECKASLLDDSLHIVILTHEEANSRYNFLSDMKPSYVVLYDPDIEIVRSIEVYQAGIKEIVKVYFLVYGGSVEEHR
jgi:hypothetical protein